MNVLDIVIVIAAVAFAFSGFRNGAVIGLLSLAGFFLGAVAGAQLAEPLGSLLAHGTAQVPIAIVCVLFLAVIGQVLGIWIGGHIRNRLIARRGRPIDASVGAVLGIVSVLLVAWMVAVPLASSPYPALASAASHSTIVRGVNKAMPHDVRVLYSRLRTYLDRSGFPPVFGDLPATSSVPVGPPPRLQPAVRKRVARAHRSVLKIYGQAPECGRSTEGSGFVYAPRRVLTNAHVVAGARQVGVQVGGRTLPARVVVFDPDRDVAVLAVPQLRRPVLHFSASAATNGDPSVVLGYPEDGPFTVRSARVRSRLTAAGSDIYGNGGIDRNIYSIRADVRSGNSGGPLLANNGTVLGVVFAMALDAAQTGYALTAGEVAPDAARGRTATTPVPTQGCTPD